ncbi:MAG: translocation/assembly module TamB domain-containing protein [Pseudomonadota bacterium]
MAQARLVLALPTRNRDFGRIFARVLCILFATLGVLPLLSGWFLSSSWVSDWAARETARVLKEQLGLTASYRVELKLLPLRLTVNELVVPASDGGPPALQVSRVAVTPRIFSLLSGKLGAGDVEVDRPQARLVIRDGKIQNLSYHLPELGKTKRAPSKQAPFGSLSIGDARFALDIDGVHVETGEVDLDVFAEQGPTFEIALRSSGAHIWRNRVVRGVPPPPPGTIAADEDVLCRLELRARYEPGDVLIRRLSALGAADLDPESGTLPTCDVVRDDAPGRVELRLSQVRIGLRKGEVPLLDGHVALRAPLPLVNRFVRAGPLLGWVSFNGDVRYDGRHKLPEVHGKLTGSGVQFERFKLAKKLDVDLDIAGDAIDIPHYYMAFADGDVNLKNARIEPFAPGVVMSAERVDSSAMTFQGLMRDLGVTDNTLIKWDFNDLRVSKISGTIQPLKIDAEVYADTKNFEVFDLSFQDPKKKRMIGVKAPLIRGHLGVRPASFDIFDTRTDFGKSSVFVKSVSIAYADAAVKMSVPKGAHIDLSDISPLVQIPIAGKADLDVDMSGDPSAALLTGNMKIQDFVFGGFPFGDITNAKLRFTPLILDLSDVQAHKGKSDYSVPSARLNFDGPLASLVTDARVKSSNFDLRDFFGIWHFDVDPRFDDIHGQSALDATVHYVLGGPEDRCAGGNLRVAGRARLNALDLFAETYDSGDADFDFRWSDRDATYQGVDLSVPSLTLHKGSGTLVGAFGMRQGGRVYGHFVGSAVPLSHLDALPTLLRAAEGQVSAVAEVSGTVDALAFNASGRVSPLRVGRATLPASKFDVRLLPIVREQKVIGTTRCGKPIGAPFDRADYDADRASGIFHTSADLFGGQVKFDDLTITRQANKVVRGEVRFSGLDAGVLAELSPTLGDSEARLTGKLGGRLSLRELRMNAPLDSKLELALSEVDVVRRGYRIELASGSHAIEFENGRFSLPGVGFTATTPRGQQVTFDAQGAIFNVATFPQISAKLSLRPMQLESLVGIIPRAERAQGVLSGQLTVVGPLFAPRFAGGFDLEHGELSIRGLPLPVSDINVALRVDGNELRVADATARVGAGTLQMSGGAPLLGLNLGAARFAIVARDLALPVNDGIRAVADADLNLSFTSTKDSDAERDLPRVTGDVTLRTFEYTRPVTMTADIGSLTQRGKRTEVEAYDPADDMVQFEVRLRSLRPMKLQNNLIDAELDIADEGLLLAGTNGRFGLRGAVRLRPRGKIFLRRSEFEVTQGRVRFDDLTRIAPEVDVTAVTEYRRYQTNTPAASSAPTATSGASSAPTSQGGRWRIQLHAHGDADKLKVDLTSDPALAQDDIFLLLTVGLTRAELDQAQSASVGESVALEALGSLSGADRAVTDAVPLIDEFRFGSAYSSRTGRTEPTVTIGKRLSQRIRANVTSGVADSREVRSNVEWQLSPRVSVEGSYDNVNDISSSTLGNLGADVRWRLEFE